MHSRTALLIKHQTIEIQRSKKITRKFFLSLLTFFCWFIFPKQLVSAQNIIRVSLYKIPPHGCYVVLYCVALVLYTHDRYNNRYIFIDTPFLSLGHITLSPILPGRLICVLATDGSRLRSCRLRLWNFSPPRKQPLWLHTRLPQKIDDPVNLIV